MPDREPTRIDTSRNPATHRRTVSGDGVSVKEFPGNRGIAAIRVVPGTGSYPVALRVRLPPSRLGSRDHDPSHSKGSR